ncbi:MAG: glycosyl transferase family 2 [Flavobacteriales bacterium CG03_land_8_20_14_0_80_35_15]|nr:ABC-F family ATP-binding cassette domain-containing protein [Zetaproteobacteria bacterium]OIO08758.1 MAG: glycosyl transferase family 2 [Flavobacteriaceae bacterium CG1_02_35_72]PIV16446.1 MAG: glycosyl transferase family 2 [Flavobacteriales bacterium CG03_land_8_20_14_0_80_35_15]PIX07124.1 MAG: glycosyl transferase family 2 [Flavobacteriales bacterium CG_4_8_14_3_um_filter_35_10]PJA04758.1 MAG: glycosyl transferase family 2 [Flavobacteriales bacterium CG_4_10_14_0_2_um_filter_35_18]
MLNVYNLCVSFSGEELFSNISFRLNSGDRVGLIGKNGAGKSTLLKIISKQIPFESGSMAFDKTISIGYLKQDLDFELGKTVIEEAYTAFTEIKKLEKKLDEINAELLARTDYESDYYHQLIHDLTENQHQYEMVGGYNYQGEAEKILIGLGFKPVDFNKTTDTLSGGWRMRIELAKLLMQKHDVLLLDEPTNHLDIESIIWLEQFLKNFAGAIMIVSHDRMFLDNVTNRTIEISLGKIYDYKKNYSEFLILRADLINHQLLAQKNQAKSIEQTEKLINKFRAKASKASMAQSLIKKLDKIERIEVDVVDKSVMKVKFQISKQPGKIIFEAENLSKNYDDKKVLSGIDLLIERSSKIAFVGQNGQGKSTLAKILVEEIDFKGHLKLGHNVEIGYFAQNQSEYLDPERTVLQIAEDAANDTNRANVRDLLGAFLFGQEAIDKKAKVLSGGERNRLALCKLMLTPFNVLVMDEPTNHLDMASKSVLKQALKNFEGTLIIVSHDRDFLQGLTDKVYEFKDEKIKEYLGDIDYFLESRNVENLREVEKRTKLTSFNKKEKNNNSQNIFNPELKQLQNKLKNSENDIAKLEKEIANLDLQLADFNKAKNLNSNPDFFKKYQKSKDQLEQLMAKWESIQEQIDTF